MSTKHLYNSPDGLVLKSLRGAVALNPGLCLHEPSKTVFVPFPSFHSSPSSSPSNLNTQKHNRVAVIAGGGSGHEPAHAGYVARGMLAAAVAGEIFASPSAKQVGCAIHLAAFSFAGAGAGAGDEGEGTGEGGGAGTGGEDAREEARDAEARDVLVVINNYTGDILNFGLAIEKARLAHRSISIESVVVADDVSLLQAQHPHTKTKKNKLPGPRGLAANILVCKILGALAERGASLGVVKKYGDAVVRSLYSVGVGLEHCHVPGRDQPKPKSKSRVDAESGERGEGEDVNGSWDGGSGLGDGECELGLGLHNEPGVRRREIGEPEGLVGDMVRMVLDGRALRNDAGGVGAGAGGGGRGHGHEGEGKEGEEEGWVLFINNLGGMSQLEMGAVVYDVLECLAHEKENIRPKRIYASAYMTSLNAPGFSISLLDVGGVRRSLEALFAPVSLSSRMSSSQVLPQDQAQAQPHSSQTPPSNPPSDPLPHSNTQALNLKEDLLNINIYDLLDAPTDATAWVGARRWEVAPIREKVGRGVVGRVLGGRAGVAAASVAPRAGAAGAGATATERTSAGVGVGPRRDAPALERALRGACHSVLRVQAELTEFDTIVGDGDCGDTFAKGAKGILQALDNGTLATQEEKAEPDLAGVISQIADILEDTMGGTIGALFAIFLNALSASLGSTISYQYDPEHGHDPQHQHDPDPEHDHDPKHKHNHNAEHKHQHQHQQQHQSIAWASALSNALKTLGKYTPAQPGDRTVVDALGPFCSHLAEAQGEAGHQFVAGAGAGAAGASAGFTAKEDEDTLATEGKREGRDTSRDLRTFKEAVRRAREGAEKTRGMKAGLGRAVYVDVDVDSDSGFARGGSEAGEGGDAQGEEGGQGVRRERRERRELPPDPGAWGVAAILEGLLEGLEGQE